MANELYLHTLRQLRDGCKAEHMDTETAALEAAIQALSCEGDCVSREAAREALDEWESQLEWDAWCYNHKNEAEKYNILAPTAVIDALPSAQPEQQWIPCSERLPEKEGWYITTVESEKTGKRRIENDLFAIDIALAHGHIPNKFCKDGYRQRTVAWCEFPEPWRGEEKNDKRRT